jgi:hypothetical protein
MAETTDFTGYRVRTRILDEDSATPVRRVRLGVAYGHVIEITRYFQLYPATLTIQSALQDTRQLAFRDQEDSTSKDSSSWEWEVTLTPFWDGARKTKLLVCAPSRKRDRDKIEVRINGDDHAILPLEVRIE